MTNFTVTPDHGMTPLTAVFTATAQPNARDYVWDFGDGHTGKGQVAAHTYVGGGSYNVVLTVVFDGASQTYKKNGAVIVSREGYFPSDFDGYAVGGSGNQGFPTGPAPLQVIFSGLNSDCEFIWDYGDGTPPQNIGKPGNPRSSHTYQTPGKYTVRLSARTYDNNGNLILINAFDRNNYITVT